MEGDRLGLLTADMEGERFGLLRAEIDGERFGLGRAKPDTEGERLGLTSPARAAAASTGPAAPIAVTVCGRRTGVDAARRNAGLAAAIDATDDPADPFGLCTGASTGVERE